MVLFAVIFLWTPPHFWALAMKFRDDYAAANVPMLPVVASAATVARKILCLLLRDGRRPRYCWRPMPAGCTGRAPRALAAGSWSRHTGSAARIAAGDAPAPMRLFHLSIAYLTLLFAVIAVTAILPFGQHW